MPDPEYGIRETAAMASVATRKKGGPKAALSNDADLST
jgi:hypothetical protein